MEIYADMMEIYADRMEIYADKMENTTKLALTASSKQGGGAV